MMGLMAGMLMLTGCASITEHGGSFGVTGTFMGVGVTIKGVVEIEGLSTNVVTPTNVVPPVVTNTPTPTPVDPAEPAGFSLATCAWVGNFQGPFAVEDTKLTSLVLNEAGADLTWEQPDWGAGDGHCDGVTCHVWKQGDAWTVGYMDYKPIAAGWHYGAAQCQNIYVGYDATVKTGDQVGTFIMSLDKAHRSNIIWRTWPWDRPMEIGRKIMAKVWVTGFPNTADRYGK
jgi:hypothetical protein